MLRAIVRVEHGEQAVAGGPGFGQKGAGDGVLEGLKEVIFAHAAALAELQVALGRVEKPPLRIADSRIRQLPGERLRATDTQRDGNRHTHAAATTTTTLNPTERDTTG